MARLVLLLPVLVVLLVGTGLAFSQGGPPGGGGGPPKVDIFAKETSNNSILVTWENPDDTADDIVFRYTVSRDVNKTDVFVPIFSSLRDIEEKIIDESNGQEMFFYLDTDIHPGSFYTYQISAGNTQGNPNPVISDDTRPIEIQDFVEFTTAEARGHLIEGRTLSTIQPIISWFDWFSPLQEVSAEFFVNPIFVTSLNPQSESYRLAIEPLPKPMGSGDCSEILEIEYTKNADRGQDFQVTATVFETQVHTDDDTGVEVSQEVLIPRYQKTFDKFTDQTKLKQKWLVIHPENQTIFNYTNLEVQFDITASFESDPAEHRNLSFWAVLFLVPVGNQEC